LEANFLADSEQSVRAGEVEPWRELPLAVADVLEPELPELTAAILAAIGREVPEYQRPLEGSFGRGIRTGVTEALRQFVALIRDPNAGRGLGREIYVGLGRGELRQGRSLDSLQAAYRVGARVAWRHTADAGRRAGLDPETLYRLAEAMFAYIDQLSSDSVEGYASEQSAREGERELRRRRLLAALLADPPADPEQLGALAADAAWPVPDRLAMLACPEEALGRVLRSGPPDWVGGRVESLGCLVVPDPDAPLRGEEIARACAGIDSAALGPAVAPADAASSWREARAAEELLAAGALEPGEGGPPFDVARAAVELTLAESRARLRRAERRRLAPLEELTPKARARAEATLRAYLDRHGDARLMAADLGIHPQTVRYRLARLRESLGPALDDPDSRFELAVLLRSRTR
jgi:hypothetical protein